jgi:peptidoglycan/LPS O-acetylase OafA/YrhL
MLFSPIFPGRYTEFDGVRGVAILLTIACNTILGWGPELEQKVWFLLAEGGWIGVQIFFVLSGFLITGILRPEALNNFPGGIFAAQLAITGSVTVLSFVLAEISDHLFEKRFLDLRRHFPRRRFPADKLLPFKLRRLRQTASSIEIIFALIATKFRMEVEALHSDQFN